MHRQLTSHGCDLPPTVTMVLLVLILLPLHIKKDVFSHQYSVIYEALTADVSLETIESVMLTAAAAHS